MWPLCKWSCWGNICRRWQVRVRWERTVAACKPHHPPSSTKKKTPVQWCWVGVRLGLLAAGDSVTYCKCSSKGGGALFCLPGLRSDLFYKAAQSSGVGSASWQVWESPVTPRYCIWVMIQYYGDIVVCLVLRYVLGGLFPPAKSSGIFAEQKKNLIFSI